MLSRRSGILKHSRMTTIFFITKNGQGLASRLADGLADVELLRFDADAVRRRWLPGERLIFIMAAGIVIRTIAPLLVDKKTDPAVVVIDEAGQHVISLLSGHLGGANSLTREVAEILSITPVVTTASDVAGLPALDLWARDNNLFIENPGALPSVMKRLIDSRTLHVFTEHDVPLPPAFLRTDERANADVVISLTGSSVTPGSILLRPRILSVGIGCNSGTSRQEIEAAVGSALGLAGLPLGAILNIATIDIKGKEPGLVDFCAHHDLPLVTYSADRLNQVPNVGHSDAVFRATGAYAVAEPSAMLAAETEWLLIEKQKFPNVTVAVARRETQKPAGSLIVAGTGPGRAEHLTPAVRQALRTADAVVGYETYIDLIRPLIPDKYILATGMTGEVERCRAAIDLARKGQNIVLVSGGDPGIYAMAGLVFELLRTEETDSEALPVTILPGISALNAAASLLGAPLMHDFCAISLSDRLTPWDVITRRIEAAAAADFVIALYNPKSHGRVEHIETALNLIRPHRSPSCPVGIVRAALREGQHVRIATIATVPFDEIDMQTTVIVGNSQTFVWKDRMVTPRGYGEKYDLE